MAIVFGVVIDAQGYYRYETDINLIEESVFNRLHEYMHNLDIEHKECCPFQFIPKKIE